LRLPVSPRPLARPCLINNWRFELASRQGDIAGRVDLQKIWISKKVPNFSWACFSDSIYINGLASPKIWIFQISANFYLVETGNIKGLQPEKFGNSLFLKNPPRASFEFRFASSILSTTISLRRSSRLLDRAHSEEDELTFENEAEKLRSPENVSLKQKSGSTFRRPLKLVTPFAPSPEAS
jgi:hypothetical protein